MIGLKRPTPPRLKKLRFWACAAEEKRPMRRALARSGYLMGRLRLMASLYPECEGANRNWPKVLERADTAMAHMFENRYEYSGVPNRADYRTIKQFLDC